MRRATMRWSYCPPRRSDWQWQLFSRTVPPGRPATEGRGHLQYDELGIAFNTRQGIVVDRGCTVDAMHGSHERWVLQFGEAPFSFPQHKSAIARKESESILKDCRNMGDAPGGDHVERSFGQCVRMVFDTSVDDTCTVKRHAGHQALQEMCLLADRF